MGFVDAQDERCGTGLEKHTSGAKTLNDHGSVPRLNKLRKNPRSGKKDVFQGLKADVFSIVYCPTKSRALIQNGSRVLRTECFAHCLVVPYEPAARPG
jgi:hypothetical protein